MACIFTEGSKQVLTGHLNEKKKNCGKQRFSVLSLTLSYVNPFFSTSVNKKKVPYSFLTMAGTKNHCLFEKNN